MSREVVNIVLRNKFGMLYLCTPDFHFAKYWSVLKGAWIKCPIQVERLKAMKRIGQNYRKL